MQVTLHRQQMGLLPACRRQATAPGRHRAWDGPHEDRWRLPRVRRVPGGSPAATIPTDVSETVSSRPRSRAAPLAPVEPVGIIVVITIPRNVVIGGRRRRGPVVDLHHPNAHQVSQRRQLRTYELVLAEV